MREFPATQPSRVINILSKPHHLVLVGRPLGRNRLKTPRFTVRTYETKSGEIAETIMQEQPYRHYLGLYTGDVLLEDLRDDIESMIAEKYPRTCNAR